MLKDVTDDPDLELLIRAGLIAEVHYNNFGWKRVAVRGNVDNDISRLLFNRIRGGAYKFYALVEEDDSPTIEEE